MREGCGICGLKDRGGGYKWCGVVVYAPRCGWCPHLILRSQRGHKTQERRKEQWERHSFLPNCLGHLGPSLCLPHGLRPELYLEQGISTITISPHSPAHYPSASSACHFISSSPPAAPAALAPPLCMGPALTAYPPPIAQRADIRLFQHPMPQCGSAL